MVEADHSSSSNDCQIIWRGLQSTRRPRDTHLTRGLFAPGGQIPAEDSLHGAPVDGGSRRPGRYRPGQHHVVITKRSSMHV